ncbi:hypothetical protein HPB50_010989 [Hyalomma asiaticum]|uniref:Uncharacterized protein n=1 Tax=Hyalomma asiaticum TaxID=266040 RepID=A0ACB7T783_HYAAI|nr:hypothetical protein HPB50_010989 [Hyalomma asiaticum]
MIRTLCYRYQNSRQKLWVEPLPCNMNLELHPGRRLACAAALHTRHSDRPEGKHVDGLSFRADTITHAEEVWLWHWPPHPTSRTTLTDLRSACSQYLQGSITPLAARLLEAASWRFNHHCIRVFWTPRHSGLPGNEPANAAARASPNRAVAPLCPETEYGNTKLMRFREILGLLPGFAPSLPEPRTRPAVARHFLPEINDTCSTCPVLADTYHVVASCPANPVPSSSPFPIPTREAWEEHVLGCSTMAAQRSLVARARAAASSSGVPE